MDTEPRIISLFSWEDIPGNDIEILLDFLKKKYGIDWVTTPKIEKIDDDKIITVTADKNSADKNYVLLSLNNEKKEVHILIDNGKTLETTKWTAKTENGKLKIYPSIYQSGIWKGAFMEGIWCGKGNWDTPGKWEGVGKWKSGKLDGGWKGEGKWSEDNDEYEGKWKGNGTLWANNAKQLGSTFTIFALISIIGFIISKILVPTGSLLRLKDITFAFVGAAILVLFPLMYIQKLKGKWSATGKWIKNQDGDRILTLDENPKSKTYLFSWDDIPGNDNGRLIEFLKKNFGIDWVVKKIEKSDDCKTIKVSTEKNDLSLKLNDEKNEVILNIFGGRTEKFVVKKEDSKLNIYSKAKWTMAGLKGELKGIIEDTPKSEAKWKIAGLKGTLEGTIEECKNFNDSEPTISLFSWENIPGNDDHRLLEYLKKKFQVDRAEIVKLDDGKIIKVIADKKYVLLSLNNEKTEVHILFDNVKTHKTEKWTAKTENGKLNIYPSIYQSGIWKGAFMEGIWCGKGNWDTPGKWKGGGQWKSGKLDGRWTGNGTWSEDNENNNQGEWKGSGILWENNAKKLGSTFRLFTIISIIGSVLGAKFSLVF